MHLNRSLHTLLDQRVDQIWADYILPKPLRLQQLQCLQCRSGIGEVLDVWLRSPVLKVVEIGNEGRVREEFARGQMLKVVWVS
jgi:hypothetical protein